ncbi:DNA glycosylase [Fomitopsis serialis]|uniref:DNA glycosylase n=1 Tax=Fomitopsis serialis TaxID=139415 RepID=UPI00200769CE|nr:DNA glycosylase [Neoantrodia serialis]KAH9931794.1 DNA glycosylase [Neoantrodia serialis]
MAEPHTPRIRSKASASLPLVRSPYFDHGSAYEWARETLSAHEDLLSDCESEEDTGESDLRVSRHFSRRTSASRMCSAARAACRDREPVPCTSESSAESEGRTALETHRSLLRNAAYSSFYDAFMRSFNRLYRAKPILIQEHVADDPWKVLVAVTLLNKTAGVHGVPVFFALVEEWPTARALAYACPRAVEERIRHLGLGRSRTARLIKLSQAYLEDPPRPGALRPSRCYMHVRVQSTGSEDTVPGIIRQRYPPTCASHLPGSGPYALDSYRIFCSGTDEWRDVRPADKELAKYLQWKWAVAEFRRWDPFHGPGESIDLAYIQSLSSYLQATTMHLDSEIGLQWSRVQLPTAARNAFGRPRQWVEKPFKIRSGTQLR